MKIDIKEVTEGKLIGQKVFACGKRSGTEALIYPTEFLLRAESETDKRVYYSECFLSPIKKDGTPYAKFIPVYDTTGFRSYPGVPLNFFDNKKECEEFFKKEYLEPILRQKQAELDKYIKILTEKGYTIIHPVTNNTNG